MTQGVLQQMREDSVVKRGRPRLIEEGEKWQLQRLTGQHHSIVMLHCLGVSNVRIADQLGITPQTVSNCINSDVAKKVIAEQLEKLYDPLTEVADIMSGSMPDVVRGLVKDFFDSDDKKERATIGFKLMDRGGYGPTRNVNVREGLTREQLDDLKAGAKKAGMVFVEEAEVIEEIEDNNEEE